MRTQAVFYLLIRQPFSYSASHPERAQAQITSRFVFESVGRQLRPDADVVGVAFASVLGSQPDSRYPRCHVTADLSTRAWIVSDRCF